jgi:23S rRNA (adenine2030-N6)-methyltransferase
MTTTPTPPTTRYAKEDLPNKYLHHFHAGNIGDLWKHLVLNELLRHLTKGDSPLIVVDCYAGAGSYRLEPTGEWTEGIGKIVKSDAQPQTDALATYKRVIDPLLRSERRYNGSPLIIRSFLRSGDRCIFHETDQETRRTLEQSLSDSGATVLEADGLSALKTHAAQAHDAGVRFFALIDPPWSKKEDWRTVPLGAIAAYNANPAGVLALWYPIKSYTRVNSMMQIFADAGVSGIALEVLTTPLEEQRNRLNGSGMLLVNAPQPLIATLAAASTEVGSLCSTHGGYWSSRITQVRRTPEVRK